MLSWVRSSDVPNKMGGDPDLCDLSDECLQDRIDQKFPNRCWMSRFDHHVGYDFSNVQNHSEQVYKEQTGITDQELHIVAKTWYPPDGYLGWHTDTPGGRIYSTWSDGESFFRYRDPETKEIITSYDKPDQWSFRIFKFSEENPIWHCVHAKDTRISVGFKFA